MFPLLLLALSTAQAAGASASSTLTDANGKHPADNAFDGLLESGWGEGNIGYGENEWLELDLGRDREIATISVWPGNLKEGAKSFREYSRPRSFTVLLDGEPAAEPVHIQDKMQRVDIAVGKTGRKVRIQVDEVYEGIVFGDLFIAEVAIDFPQQAAWPLGRADAKGTPPDELKRMDDWLKSKDAERRLNDFEQKAQAAYEAVKAAEFGDDDAFSFLTRAAAEGPDYMAERARANTPVGFRAQAVRSDAVARYALRKLKDPNGIPAMELALLRAVGEDERDLEEIVEIFYAYQDLIGGGNRNMPYWGDTGWVLGGIQSFGEPINLAIDRYYSVFVADVGNSRIERFSDEGRPERQWGPEADITNVWFNKGRPYYVSGARPGEGPGEFMNPIDIEIIPDKEEDGFAVIDAANRVQIFDSEGHMQISWTVQTDRRPEPKLGGQSYLAWVPKKQILVAFVRNEAVAYTLDSEELFRWTVEDGTPNAVVAMPNGQLLLAYGGEVVRYNLDGFRHGTVIDRDTLGQGFEDIDLAIDEAGKLWVVTDTGWFFKFKRPGKVELKVKASERPLVRPRFAVRQGIAFLTSDDQIERIDVLQVKLDQEQAAEEAAENEEL